MEIYVRPFPARSGGQHVVSTGGGIWPRWSRDGHELYYVDLKGQLMAASAAMTSGEFAAGTPGKLFNLEIAPDARIHHQYAVGPDGRFLVRTRQESTAPITVVLNWGVP